MAYIGLYLRPADAFGLDDVAFLAPQRLFLRPPSRPWITERPGRLTDQAASRRTCCADREIMRAMRKSVRTNPTVASYQLNQEASFADAKDTRPRKRSYALPDPL